MTLLKPLFDQALSRGVMPEALAALVLLPLVATFVSAARYLVGVRGLGIYTPVLMAAVFWLTGVNPGFYLFLVMMVVVTLAHKALKEINLHYLARVALLFWFICLTILVFLLGISFSLLPLLLLIFLTQDFLKIQLAQGFRSALRLSLETMILALGGMFLLACSWLQRLALNQPEVVILGTLLFNLFVGRFTGLRLLEYHRFKRLFK